MSNLFQDMADYLVSGHWDDTERRAYRGARRFDQDDVTVYLGELQAKDKPLVTEALQYWTEITGLTFSTTNRKPGADLVIKNGSGRDQAWSSSELNTRNGAEPDSILKSVVAVSKDWSPIQGPIADPDDFLGSFRFGTFIHEIGHALGLGHQGNYNGDVRPRDIVFPEDSLQYSVMSYIDHPFIRTGPNSDTITMPGIVDVLAMQDLYGRTASNTGNTVYGVESTASQQAYDADWLTTTMVTIYDTSGAADLLNFRDTSARQIINLTAGEFSNVYGKKANVVIALGVIIEDANGGGGNDRMTGNHVGNALQGLGGNDRLLGRKGSDWLQGDDGQDVLRGGRGRDTLEGGAGSDKLFGGAGRDLFVFKSNFGNDRIVGFDSARDQLEFGGATPLQISSEISEDDFIMRFSEGNSVTFENLDILQTDPSLTVSEIIDMLL